MDISTVLLRSFPIWRLVKYKYRSPRRLILESYEPRLMLTIQLVADVEASNRGSHPRDFAALGDAVLFATQDSEPPRGEAGFQLYQSDGTSQGTTVLQRFDGRKLGSEFIVVGSHAYFTTTLRNGNQQQLWRTDGMPEGTKLVKHLAEFSPFSAQGFVAMGDHLFFYHDAGENQGLWRTDGSESGTVLVSDVRNFGLPVAIRDTLYFTAVDEVHGRELWRTDGTEEGTSLVKDVLPGAFSSDIRFSTVVADRLYFFANDGTNGNELWTSDGTEAGTQLVKDLAPGLNRSEPAGISPQWTVAADDLLYFAAKGNDGRHELYRSDGTPDGTAVLTDSNARPSRSQIWPYAVVGNELLFRVSGVDNSLWWTDGTANGTQHYERTTAGFPWSENEVTVVGSTFPVYLELEDGHHAFVSVFDDAATGAELEFDDGTPMGWQLLVDAIPGPQGSVVASAAVKVAGQVFYSGDDGLNGAELWKTDGTPAGTGMVKNISHLGSFGSRPSYPTEIDGLVYFHAQRFGPAETQVGREVWVSDGTPDRTRLLKDINPGAEGQVSNVDPNFTKAGDTIFFLASTDAEGVELWKTDGTEAGTSMVRDIVPGPETAFRDVNSFLNPQLFTVLNDEVYFIANDGRGSEIWKSDGTESGTQRVTRLRRDGVDPHIIDLTVFGDEIYFSANDGVNGSELWRTRGNAASTEIVTAIQSQLSAYVRELTVVGERMYFVADTLGTGSELWVTDGTAEGTRLVRDIANGFNSSTPQGLTAFGDQLYFTADTRELGRELWKSDGTLRGTELVSDIFPGRESSFPTHLAAVGEQLFFFASEPTTGRELWVSDGTRTGTRIVENIQSVGGLNALDLFVVADKVGFVLEDQDLGYSTIWLSDGTAERTSSIDALKVFQPNSFSVSHGVIYVSAEGGEVGEEVWSIEVLNPSSPQVSASELNAGSVVSSRLASLSFSFTHDVSASLSAADLSVVDAATSEPISAEADFSWDVESQTGTWTFHSDIQPGHFIARLNGAGIQDEAGSLLDGNHDFIGGDDHEYQFTLHLAGDANGDGAVSFDDFLLLGVNFGRDNATRRDGDFTGDGRVQFTDFLILALNFGKRLGDPS